MELFLPGLIVLLLSAFFVFLILPRFGSTILAVTSMLAILVAGYHHYHMFAAEYRLSTWQSGLTAYAPWIILLLAFFFIIGSLQHIMSGSGSVVSTVGNSATSSYAAMPSASTATNPITALVNTTLKKANNLLTPGNRRNGGSPLIPNLGFKASNA
jgi:hypothetical protein